MPSTREATEKGSWKLLPAAWRRKTKQKPSKRSLFCWHWKKHLCQNVFGSIPVFFNFRYDDTYNVYVYIDIYYKMTQNECPTSSLIYVSINLGLISRGFCLKSTNPRYQHEAASCKSKQTYNVLPCQAAVNKNWGTLLQTHMAIENPHFM